MRKHILIKIILLVAMSFLAIHVAKRYNKRALINQSSPYVSTIWRTMGTVASLTISKDNNTNAQSIAESTCEEVSSSLSVFNKDSTLSQLNANAGSNTPTLLDKHTFYVLEQSLNYNTLTHGAFNPAITPILELWGFKRSPSTNAPVVIHIPNENNISEKLQLIDFVNNTTIDKENSAASLSQKNMKLDFGGIAKGYCVDEIAKNLCESNQRNFLVDIGGNIKVDGVNSSKNKWRVGIKNPLYKENSSSRDTIGYITLNSGYAVATSGSYERFSILDGKKFSHIIDPRSGRPVENEILQVTVISKSALQADALSTSCFILGVKDGISLINSIEDTEAIFITTNSTGNITYTISDESKVNFTTL